MWQLRAGLHGRTVQGTPVFLDLETGRYSLLRGTLAQSFTAFESGVARIADVTALSNAGILRIGEPLRPGMPPVARTAEEGKTSLHVPAILQTEAILTQLIYRFRRSHAAFRDLLAARTRRWPVALRASRMDEPMIAAAFARTQSFLPWEGHCLSRSLAIATTLGRRGHQPRIVIGVHLPFAAHCWVQCDDRVIGDPLEQIQSFTPLAAL